MNLVPTLSHKVHILAKFKQPGRQFSDAHSSLWFAVNQLHSFASLGFSLQRMSLHPFDSLGLESQEAWEGGTVKPLGFHDSCQHSGPGVSAH